MIVLFLLLSLLGGPIMTAADDDPSDPPDIVHQDTGTGR